jgi:hypothetical protein
MSATPDAAKWWGPGLVLTREQVLSSCSVPRSLAAKGNVRSAVCKDADLRFNFNPQLIDNGGLAVEEEESGNEVGACVYISIVCVCVCVRIFVIMRLCEH